MSNPTKIPKLAQSDHNPSARTQLSCLSVKSVLLYDWWLARADGGKGLAVAGFTTRERQGVRGFCSAAIVKRHDTTILESKDGILITVCGFINRSRTLQNGFPAQICSWFLLGFPYGWEKYATPGYCEESADKDVGMGISGSGRDRFSIPPVSFDDLPVTKIRDTLMFSLGDSLEFSLHDILRPYRGKSSKHTTESSSSNMEGESPVTSVDHKMDQTPCGNKSSKGDLKDKDVKKFSTAAAATTTVEQCINQSGEGTTRMRDSLMFPIGDAEDISPDATLLPFCSSSSKQSPSSSCLNLENKSAGTGVDHKMNQTPCSNKTSKADLKEKDTNEISAADAAKTMEQCFIPSAGVTTRSMSRSRKLRSKQEDRHSDSPILCRSSNQKPERKLPASSATMAENDAGISASEEATGNAEKASPATISLDETLEVPNKSPCRIYSGRLRNHKRNRDKDN
ncbi:hypothetical protein Tsubulata_029971 [Turnera subulata]|uniref:SANTA domain-containing protein n=1 Tax=Turnera subulata TaxID=218843 RepID=A0A9Q0FXD1_9ROSI|nr:hypothetical protein Tsubulata_029971 [Turnera subulata]